jgi:tRNA A-37 threonylcarbamoyl transferase component Bud32
MVGKSSLAKAGNLPLLSAQGMQRAGHHIDAPFELSLKTRGVFRKLVCQKILRNLPGKRLVCFGLWGENEAVVAKIYLDRRRGKKHFKREVNGIRHLITANIPTPPILFKGTLSDGRTPILLLQRVQAAQDLTAYLALGDQVTYDVNQLMKEVVETIARMHQNGLSQRDIHPGNFLIKGNVILVIDGADIRRHRRTPLSERLSISNLALFLAQFYPARVNILQELVVHYGRCRHWQMTPEWQSRAHQAVVRWSDWREKKFLRKTLRPCTAFIAQKTWHHQIACDRTWHASELQPLIEDPDSAMAGGTILKDGNTATVFRTICRERQIVIKRYNLKNMWHAFRRSLRPTRAIISWRSANRLRFMGIPTPQPLAVIEKRWGPLRGRGYFIMEYLPGNSIDRVIKNSAADLTMLTRCADLLLQLLKRLHQLRLSHGDLKASNLLLFDDQLYMLDLDGMQKHHSTRRFRVAFQRDIKRLLQNWQHETIFYPLLKKRIKEAFPNA